MRMITDEIKSELMASKHGCEFLAAKRSIGQLPNHSLQKSTRMPDYLRKGSINESVMS